MLLTVTLQVSQPRKRPVVLSGHTNEVTAVAWCGGDQNEVATCGDDATLRVWRVNRQYPAKYNTEMPCRDWAPEVSGPFRLLHSHATMHFPCCSVIYALQQEFESSCSGAPCQVII